MAMARPCYAKDHSTDFGAVAPAPSRSANASTGRSMFLKISGPSSSKARSSRPRTWSRTDRESRCHPADIRLEVSPQHSPRPRADQSRLRLRRQCRFRHQSGWPDQAVDLGHGAEPAAASAGHSAPPRRCYRTRSVANRPRSEQVCHRAPCIAGSIRLGGAHAAVRAFQRRPTRSNGCSQQYQHRQRRSACVDLATVPIRSDALLPDMAA